MSDIVEDIVGLQEAREWIESVTSLKFAYASFRHSLRSGVLLCREERATKRDKSI